MAESSSENKSESSTPTGDAADRWLRRQNPNNPNPTASAVEDFINHPSSEHQEAKVIGPEDEQFLAKTLATELEGIQSYLAQHMKSEEYRPPELSINRYDDTDTPRFIIRSYNNNLCDKKFIGQDGIDVDTQPTWDKIVPTKLGVNTAIKLEAHAHTDIPTQDAVKKYFDGKADYEWMSLRSSYYFDKEGNFAKVSVFPRGIETDRPDVLTADEIRESNPTAANPYEQSIIDGEIKNLEEYRFVASEMTEDDWKIAQKAVRTLKDRIGVTSNT